VPRGRSLDHARSQVGQPHSFRIPTWAQCSDRRMGDRTYQSALTRLAHIHVRKDRSIVLRRFIAFGQFRSAKRKGSDKHPTPHFDIGPSTALGSHLCVALSSVWAISTLIQKTTKQTIDTNHFFIEVARRSFRVGIIALTSLRLEAITFSCQRPRIPSVARSHRSKALRWASSCHSVLT
jgi:hypothetical protein